MIQLLFTDTSQHLADCFLGFFLSLSATHLLFIWSACLIILLSCQKRRATWLLLYSPWRLERQEVACDESCQAQVLWGVENLTCHSDGVSNLLFVSTVKVVTQRETKSSFNRR